MQDRDLVARTTCAALLITCSDFRFKGAERRFADAAALADDYDLIARPGAIRSVVLPRDAAAEQTMYDEIALLWKLHRFTRIVAVNHVSCRAYDDIATSANEREIHVEHLRRARALLDARFAGVTTEGYLAVVGDAGIAVEPVR
jgi:hypothetical protein